MQEPICAQTQTHRDTSIFIQNNLTQHLTSDLVDHMEAQGHLHADHCFCCLDTLSASSASQLPQS